MGRTRTLLSATLAILALSAQVTAFETRGKALAVLDHGSGVMLAAKNADEPLPPASMSKLMTILMTFEAIEEGRLRLTDKLLVSRQAVAYEGSSMFLNAGERISVEDLIRGVIVLSGNDASAVLAEALSPDGTEAGFASMMTERGREIGMERSNFTNSNGWPDSDHVMTTRDLVILASHLIREFPQYYPYFAEAEFAFDGRVPSNRFNRNPLLTIDLGADGLKTGYTAEAGYGFVGSAKRGDRRVVFAVAGLDAKEIRATEAERIVNWYFFNFLEKTLYSKDDVVLEQPVWLGDKKTVPVLAGSDVAVPVPATADGEIKVSAVFEDYPEAPLREGDPIGLLAIEIPGISGVASFPLIAGNSVSEGGSGVRLMTVLRTMFNKAAPDLLTR